MGPTWVLSAPDGPHVGPMNLAIGEWWHPKKPCFQVADFRQDTGLVRNDEPVIFYDENEREKEVSGSCVEDCELCSPDTDRAFETVLIENGTALLLAILPVHDSFSAERVSVNGLKSVEAFRLILNRMNTQGILNDMGITMGYQVRDSFG